MFGMEKRGLRGCLITLYNSPKGGSSEVTSDRTKGNGFRLCHARLSLGIRKNFFPTSVVWPRNKLLSEVGASPCLEVFKICVGVASGDTAGHDDLRGLFQPQHFYDSMGTQCQLHYWKLE